MNYKYPSLRKQVQTYIRETGRHALLGFPKASEVEVEERTGICQTCPSRDPKHNRCTKCGCFLKLKIPRKDAFCELGKWKNAR